MDKILAEIKEAEIESKRIVEAARKKAADDLRKAREESILSFRKASEEQDLWLKTKTELAKKEKEHSRGQDISFNTKQAVALIMQYFESEVK